MFYTYRCLTAVHAFSFFKKQTNTPTKTNTKTSLFLNCINRTSQKTDTVKSHKYKRIVTPWPQNYSKTERPLAAEAEKDPIDVHEKQTLRQLIQLWFDFFIKADRFLHRFTSE